jgi:hypothetical protein
MGGTCFGGTSQLWQQAAKTLVFMKLFRCAPHYSRAVWRN